MPERPEEPPAIRVTAMPAHTNMYGDIFGGWLMSQMDLAASSVASRHARGRAVTVAVDGMSFHQAVVVGDEVSVYADLTQVGRTSMKVHVQTWARERHEGLGVEEHSRRTDAFRPRPRPGHHLVVDAGRADKSKSSRGAGAA